MAVHDHSIGHKKDELNEIGPGFWNVRSHFKLFGKIGDIGTHMSIVRLSDGNFVVFDTVELTDHLKEQIDRLTNNGDLIEGVIGAHPYHTRSFMTFYQAYPQAAYYGTPRHLRQLPEIPWLGSLDDCNVRRKWEPDVEMRITAGGEFINPHGESANHFMSVFIYHGPSRTLHVDDTINFTDRLRFFFKLFRHPRGLIAFHPSFKGQGLHPTAEAPYLFRDWMRNMLNDWPFENLCCAHLDALIGDAHAEVTELLNKTEPALVKLSQKNKRKNPKGIMPINTNPNIDVTGDECG